MLIAQKKGYMLHLTIVPYMLAASEKLLYHARMSIEYVSTRDPERQKHSYDEVLLQGLAPDGGLYIPTAYPRIDEADLRKLTGKPYVDVFTAVNGLFVGDSIPSSTQRELAEQAYNHDKFPDVREGNVTPIRWLTDHIAVQELSLGPTAAFKDMALQVLGQHFQHALAATNESLTMLGATSGDTGSSAEAAMKGLGHISLTMLSPEEGMSDFQKAQMAGFSGDNILNISVKGRFDDCQDMVKALKKEPEFAQLGAVNSINWGRVAAQVAYYVHGYTQAVEGDIGRLVDFVVPTGNFGNVLAGYIAKQMGVPIRRLIVATNENSVVDELIQTGVYSKPPKAHITSSPSMDITVASNYERLVADIFPNDPYTVTDYMRTFESKGIVYFREFGVPTDILHRMGFESGMSTHQNRLAAIRYAYDRSNTIIDPHTADAVTVALQEQMYNAAEHIPLVCMSTALPVKFEHTIREALGFVPERPERFKRLEERAASKAGSFAVIAAGDLKSLASLVQENTAH